nr:class I SAM-dependent methyltransferase [Actinomycetota bacterium]
VQVPATLDEQLETFADSLLGAALATAELTIAHLGRALGLYAALRGEADGLTPPEVASRCGVDERYAREWLEHQAVAGVVIVDDPDSAASERRYVLPEAHAIVILDEEHPAYVGALTDIPPVVARTLDQVTSAFRSGAGVPFAAYGLHDMQAGFTRPMFATSLVGEWLPALPEVHARLQAGEQLRLADFGCGEGWAAIYLAEAYPNVTVDGFDLDDASIATARKHAADRGVADRARFEVRDITDPGLDGAYDLAMACEVIHDLPDPVGALTTMRRVTGDAGAVLIIDEKAADTFTPDGDPIERLLYAFSILHCLPAGRDAVSSVCTGTVMRPDIFAGYATAAGFGTVEQLPVEHPMFRFYRPVH